MKIPPMNNRSHAAPSYPPVTMFDPSRPPRSGRRWVDPADPVEATALAAGYAALRRAVRLGTGGSHSRDA